MLNFSAISWRVEFECNWGSNSIVINYNCVCDLDRSLGDVNTFVLSSTGNGVSNVTDVLMQVSLFVFLLLCS